MRAVVYTESGSSDVLQVVDRPVPEPGPGEVRVRVVVSGVNPTDWKRRAGFTAPGVEQETVPNQDGAGVVDALGAGVHDLSVGDRVWLYLAQHERPTGTAQEYTVVPAERAVPLPDDASFDVGADLGVPALTAHRALTVAEQGPDRLSPGALAGRTVLVAGGAGAVGNAAIQLARWAGATVITTISGERKAQLARAAGAHHIINYREQDVRAVVRELAPDGVDVVVEVSPAHNLELDLDVLAPRGTVSIYANDGGETVQFPVRAAMSGNVRLQFVLLYFIGEAALRAGIEDVTAAVAAGAFGVGEEHGLPLHRFTLERTADAHQAVQDGAVGKVLIDVAAR